MRVFGSPVLASLRKALSTDSGSPLTIPKRLSSELLAERAAPVSCTLSSERENLAACLACWAAFRALRNSASVVARRASVRRAAVVSAPKADCASAGVSSCAVRPVVEMNPSRKKPIAKSLSRRDCCSLTAVVDLKLSVLAARSMSSPLSIACSSVPVALLIASASF